MNKHFNQDISPILELQNIVRLFNRGDTQLQILKDISLHVYSGEIVALIGASGSGKSTLLQIAGLLEHPTEGKVLIDRKNVNTLTDNERTALRSDTIGFVYQFHHLLPEFSALENIMIPQMIRGISSTEAHSHALRLLNSMNLSARATHRPSKLSGGEQQRIALLLAIANKPRLLLADEPTGNLDEATTENVFSELLSMVRTHNIGALIATHDMSLACRMDRTIRLFEGTLEELNLSN